MRELTQNTAANVMVFMTLASDHVSGATGKTLTITASKDGGAFGAITPTVTERGSGWYNLALTAGHNNTLGDLALHVTAADCDPTDVKLLVIAFDKAVAKQAVTLAAGDVSGNLPANALAMADGLIQAAKIQDGAFTAAKFAAASLNGKGDWNIGKTGYALDSGQHTAIAAATEAAILDEGDATPLLAAIAAKVEEFLINEGDATATLGAIAAAVWANGTRTLTSGANISLAKGTGITGFNDPSVAEVYSYFVDGSRPDAFKADLGPLGSPAQSDDARLDNLDAAVSSRLASAGYTAPDNAGIASAAASASSAASSASAAASSSSTAASAASAAAGLLAAITEDVGGLRLTEHAFDAMPAATVELDEQAIDEIAQGVVAEIGDALALELAEALGPEIAAAVVGEALETYNTAGTLGKVIQDILTKVNTLNGGGGGGGAGPLDYTLQFNLGQSGQALYFVLWNDAGQAWHVGAEEFVEYTDQRELFAIAMDEVGTSGYYSAAFPDSGAGYRRWEIFVQDGEAPAHGDISLAEGDNAGGSGGGQLVHVPILPVGVNISTGQVTSSSITLYRNASIGPLVFVVRDSLRLPVDLSGKQIRFHLWRDADATPLVNLGPFTASGEENNVVSVSDAGPLTTENGDYSYTLWNATDKVVLATGRLTIEAQPSI